MDQFSYWENRHVEGRTGWHRNEIHPYLTDFTTDLDLSPPKRVLVPLCGRCLELLWFYEKDLEVVGVEMIEAPVKQFYEEHKLPYTVKELPWAKLYETKDERLKIYVCSIYDVDVSEIGQFDVIWDRASLTAIESDASDKYVKLMKSLLTKEFLYLLTNMQYDDKNTTTPVPRNISHEQTKALYGDWSNVTLLTTADVSEERIKKTLNADEIWESYFLMTPK